MVDSCFLCRRTQVDLDHLNEEIRTRVYLSYFSNARAEIDERQRRYAFLQRLDDEESGDAHFRINAKQVFADPKAYEKLMPWVDTLLEIARDTPLPPDDSRTIGRLVEDLLREEHRITTQMEEGLSELRSDFATGSRSPLTLEVVTLTFPAEWKTEGLPFNWHPSQPSDREPLRRDASGTVVEVPVRLCSVCRKLTDPAGALRSK